MPVSFQIGGSSWKALSTLSVHRYARLGVLASRRNISVLETFNSLSGKFQLPSQLHFSYTYVRRIYTYIYDVYIYILCVCMYIYMYICVCIYMYIHMYMYVCMYVCWCVCVTSKFLSTAVVSSLHSSPPEIQPLVKCFTFLYNLQEL